MGSRCFEKSVQVQVLWASLWPKTLGLRWTQGQSWWLLFETEAHAVTICSRCCERLMITAPWRAVGLDRISAPQRALTSCLPRSYFARFACSRSGKLALLHTECPQTIGRRSNFTLRCCDHRWREDVSDFSCLLPCLYTVNCQRSEFRHVTHHTHA